MYKEMKKIVVEVGNNHGNGDELDNMNIWQVHSAMNMAYHTYYI
jgi:hypothetical protein